MEVLIFGSRASRDTGVAARLVTKAMVAEAIQFHHKGVVVKTVDVVRVHRCGDGLASTTDRVHLAIDSANQPAGVGSPIPNSAVMKIILLSRVFRIGASPAVVAAAGAFSRFCQRTCGLGWVDPLIWWGLERYQRVFPHAPDAMYINEARFYREVRPSLPAEIETPQVYGTVIDAANHTYGVLIEDLSQRSVRFGSALSSVSVGEVRSLLTVLAQLHAAYWDAPPSWLPTHTVGGMSDAFNAIGRGLVEDQCRRHAFKNAAIAPLGASVKTLWSALGRAQALLSTDIPTLCHGDPHVGNTYFDADTGRAGFLDWQLCIRGSAMHDVTYIIITALPTETRRAEQHGLLQHWAAELARFGVPNAPAMDHIWLRYRQAAIWGLVIGWLICPPVNYGVPITRTNVERLADACEDLGTLEALGL